MSNTHSFPGPECMQADEYSAADAARQKLAPKQRFRVLSSLTDLRSRGKSLKSKTSDISQEGPERSEVINSRPSTGTTATVINLDGSAIANFNENKDVYQWATLYENQRGLTIFSTPYYSCQSLLPNDPLAYTVPCASAKLSEQPEVSLSEYPLPDGTWRWVSKSWMIDMRTDSGEVQHDGFEYNWRFRQEKWKAYVGRMSAGGLVRRRRWVRLMMRPARITVEDWDAGAENGNGGAKSVASSLSGANITNDAADVDARDVWKGDNIEEDWQRCHALMKRLGRDGRKLELWKRWLGGYYSEHLNLGHLFKTESNLRKQWTEDDAPVPSQMDNLTKLQPIVTEGASPSLDHVAAVLRAHGDILLHSFIYPDSRAQFLDLLGRSGLLPEVNVGLGVGWSTTDIDFWSYASGLDKSVEEDDAKLQQGETEGEEGEKALVDAYTQVEGKAEVPTSVVHHRKSSAQEKKPILQERKVVTDDVD